MAKTITLKYPAKCADCGADLEVGTKARWYGRGRVYGFDCHHKNPDVSGPMRGYVPGEPTGLTLSRFDRWGVYTPDGRKIGSSCHCEDYPCCGH